MRYFEYNLPETPPVYLDGSFTSQFQDVVQRVSARMDKLENALIISGMDGATFSAIAKKLFDNFFESFEAQTASQLAKWVQDFFDGTIAEPRMEWPNAEVVIDCSFVTTKEWEMIRHIGIGGSDAAVILGAKPYRSMRQLYYDKTGTPVKLPEEDNSAVFMRGHFMEDKVINAFCKITGAKRIPESRMFRSKKFPASTANPDAIVQTTDGHIYVFEAKTTKEENWPAWAGTNIPPQYVPQTRQYPAVLADDRICGTYIGCLFVKDYILGGDFVGCACDENQFRCHSVERDADEELAVLEAEEQFLQDYLIPGIVPASISADPKKDVKVLRTYSGPADPALPTMMLDASRYADAANRYLALNARIKEASDALKRLENQRTIAAMPFIEELGQTVEGHIHINDKEYIEVKHSPRSRTEVDREKLAIAFPDAYAACVTYNPESSRVFSLKTKTYKPAKKTKASSAAPAVAAAPAVSGSSVQVTLTT